MIASPYIDTKDDPCLAQTLTIHVCGDDMVHFALEDAAGNLLGDMRFDPEEALAVARRIEQAADVALGIA